MPPRKTYPSDSDPNHEEYPTFYSYDLFVSRGTSYFRLGQYQHAIEEYDKALKMDPNDAIGYYNRGLSYRRLGQYQRAIEDCDKAIELDPDNAEPYNKLKMRIV